MTSQTQGTADILVVDDDRSTAELVAKVLMRSGRVTCTAHCAQDAIERLKSQRFEMVLLDYLLGDSDCWSVLETARRLNPPIPVVVVTGSGSERIAVEALRRGAADYIIKNGDYWKQLPEIATQIIQTAAGKRLRENLAAVVESSDDGIIGNTVNGKIISWNLGAQAVFGYTTNETMGISVFDLFAFDHRAEVQSKFEKLMRGEHAGNFNSVGICKAKEPVHLSIGISALMNRQNQIGSITIVARDITDPQWLCAMRVGLRLAHSAVPRRW